MLTFLATGDDTSGQFALIEARAARGSEPPLHVHDNEDETFYILEGEAMVVVGDERHRVSAGDCLFLPRGVPHTFKLLSEEARALLLISPAGFENYFRTFAVPAEDVEVAPSATRWSDEEAERMVLVGARYGLHCLASRN